MAPLATAGSVASASIRICGLSPRSTRAGEIGRDGDDEGDVAAGHQDSASAALCGDMVEAVIAGDLQRRDHGARVVVAAGRHERGRQALRIVVDGVAEQHQLHQRHAQHHGEGDAVAPHLDEFLDQQRAEPGEGEDAVHAILSFEPRHELDEHVLEAGLARRRPSTPSCSFSTSASAASSACRVGADDMQRGAERRHLVDAGACPAALRPPGRGAGPARTKVVSPAFFDHLVDRAGGQHLAVGDVADAVAALGLVHVVGGDQHGQPAAGEAMDLVPELAPRLRVDAGRRLVEQQQLRLVHDAGGERQPLLPAAGQRAGQLVAARWSGRAPPASRRHAPRPASAGRAAPTNSRFSPIVRSS